MSSIRSFAGIQPTIAEDVYIDEQATVIGKVTIGQSTSIWPQAVLRGDVNTITVGQYCNIQDGAVVHVTHQSEYSEHGHPTVIGNEVTIGHQAMLHGCTIGNQVLIGMQAILLDGCVVPDHVVIGAGSLVPPGKYLDSGYVYVGTPVKRVRELTSEERAYFSYSAKVYAELAGQYKKHHK